jgi:putative chitinase
MADGFDFNFTEEQVHHLLPRVKNVSEWYEAMVETLPQYGINDVARVSAFIAQCAHESGGFTLMQENLNYSADGLQKIFGKYFPNPQIATQYARQPEKIANRVYANRMGNGNQASGDGFKFCGRGYIQLTGRDNYTAFDNSVEDDILATPDLVATKYPLLSAAWFWNKNVLNKIADTGVGEDVITKITKKINGGTIGLADRVTHFNEYYNLLKA